MSYQENELTIRPIKDDDLERLWELIFKEESPEWKKWDAPYYELKQISFEEFWEQRATFANPDNRWAIVIAGEVIGTVGYYWEHEPSKWLEMGIVIYDPKYWSGGYGTNVIRLWINHLFHTLPLVRVGYTTWSGNERMIKVGEKLGMKMEARIRKVRYYNGEYYDSIRMGLLREEWEMNQIFHKDR
ncbi:GNAT family N-acetyltransferase [Robertmurraya andreesenii]|uniref:RimJ/RimL family protein N-acetyltransferase n=1 Tax=Anoxybacillus andreesenii TaxID=1325932 RepID=A0ABT9VAK1_9BACL|nr:GNAT family protein [Robertmurraya andreesenii]MDQ0157993.1 RimJ/RimL family protein N-acetyltransferase [Robertmurraya andreesenii]